MKIPMFFCCCIATYLHASDNGGHTPRRKVVDGAGIVVDVQPRRKGIPPRTGKAYPIEPSTSMSATASPLHPPAQRPPSPSSHQQLPAPTSTKSGLIARLCACGKKQ